MELTTSMVVVLAAESKPTTIEGEEVNTGRIYQRIGSGANPVNPNNSQSAISTTGLYNLGAEGRQVFQLSSYIENTGIQFVAGVFGKAIAPKAWGMVAAGFTQGTGLSRGMEIVGGRRPNTLICAKEVLSLEPGGSVEVENPEPEGWKTEGPGIVEIGGGAGRLMSFTKITGKLLEGCEIISGESKTIKKGAQLHTAGDAQAQTLLLVGAGGNLYGGLGPNNLITFEVLTKSSAENGIVWPFDGETQIVSSTGSLWLVEAGLKAAYGLNLENGEFTTAAISLGNNNITAGTGTGAKIATSNLQKLGFWGATPITRPTVKGEVPKGGPASLIKALTEAGLITNETTETTPYVVPAKVKATERIEEKEVNTEQILQSIGKANPLVFGIPAFGTDSLLNISSGPTQLAIFAGIENVGTTAAVAVQGRAVGPEALGGVFSAYTEGSGTALGMRIEAGNRPLTVESAEEVTLPEKGGSLKVVNIEPEGKKLASSGTLAIGSSGRTFTYEKITGTTIEGITITAESKLVRKGAVLHGGGGAASGLAITSFGGQITGGSGLTTYVTLLAEAASAASAGISLEKNGSAQPLTSTGSLIIAQSGVEAAYGLNLEKGTWTTAAIALGNNNIVVGEGAGAKVGTAVSQKLGFWGATPITRPKVTGSRSSGAALVSLLEALANAGLIANESSP
jgi:hypothetical protein